MVGTVRAFEVKASSMKAEFDSHQATLQTLQFDKAELQTLQSTLDTARLLMHKLRKENQEKIGELQDRMSDLQLEMGWTELVRSELRGGLSKMGIGSHGPGEQTDSRISEREVPTVTVSDRVVT